MDSSVFCEKMRGINKSVPIPQYYQIKTVIVGMIEDHTLQVGDRLPSESEIVAHADFSRPTIRQALNELVAEGFLVRRQGKGTFVSAPKLEARYFQHLQSFNDEMRQKKLTPTTRVLAQEVIKGEPAINLELGIPPGEPLIYLHRLRGADMGPIVLSESFVPYNHFPQLLDVDFATNSLLNCYRDMYDCPVGHVVRYVEAVNSTLIDAELLQIKPGDAICLVKSCAYSAEGRALEYTIARYRGDRTKFKIEMVEDRNRDKGGEE